MPNYFKKCTKLAWIYKQKSSGRWITHVNTQNLDSLWHLNTKSDKLNKICFYFAIFLNVWWEYILSILPDSYCCPRTDELHQKRIIQNWGWWCWLWCVYKEISEARDNVSFFPMVHYTMSRKRWCMTGIIMWEYLIYFPARLNVHKEIRK